MSPLLRRAPPPTESQGFGHAELSAGGSRVLIIPELGGKIASMEIGGRQWLWTNPAIPYRAPAGGASYAETADTGGFNECFPTVGACTLLGSAESFNGVALPDHGELWSQRPKIDVKTRVDGQQAKVEWAGVKMPYHFTRIIGVDVKGAVTMRYSVRNDGHSRLPFIWSAQALFPLTDRTRLVLPVGEPVRVFRAERVDMGGVGAEHRWPNIRAGKDTFDLSRPGAVGKRYACKLFFDSVPGVAALEQDGARLEVRFAREEVPDFGLWINNKGWSPKRTIRPYQTVGFGPSIGAPDTLSDALGGWRRAHWLEPGAKREWTLTWTSTSPGTRPGGSDAAAVAGQSEG